MVTLPPCLQVSIGLRVPVFPRDAPAVTKISDLESYLLLSAYTQGELTEARLNSLLELVPLEDEWNHMDPELWQHLKRTRTETAVRDSKRQVRPDLYDRIAEVKWLIKRLTEEIDRMERDSVKVSRVYTMITGS